MKSFYVSTSFIKFFENTYLQFILNSINIKYTTMIKKLYNKKKKTFSKTLLKIYE